MLPGFYTDLDAATYHDDPCAKPSLNYSTAKALVNLSPWHAYKQHPRLGGERWIPSKKMDEGSIVHAMLLGQPLDGSVAILPFDNFKTKASQTARDEAKESGNLVVLADRYDELRAAIPAIRANLSEAGIELGGHREATIVWDADCLCRTRVDHVSRDLCSVIDLKCTASANPKFLERHIVDMCYDVQAAAEIEAIETIRPELVGRVKFADVFIELEAPYFVVVADHTESMLDHGRSRWARAKRTWIECLETNHWAGFTNRVMVHAPNWAINKEFGEVVS